MAFKVKIPESELTKRRDTLKPLADVLPTQDNYLGDAYTGGQEEPPDLLKRPTLGEGSTAVAWDFPAGEPRTPSGEGGGFGDFLKVITDPMDTAKGFAKGALKKGREIGGVVGKPLEAVKAPLEKAQAGIYRKIGFDIPAHEDVQAQRERHLESWKEAEQARTTPQKVGKGLGEMATAAGVTAPLIGAVGGAGAAPFLLKSLIGSAPYAPGAYEEDTFGLKGKKGVALDVVLGGAIDLLTHHVGRGLGLNKAAGRVANDMMEKGMDEKQAWKLAKRAMKMFSKGKTVDQVKEAVSSPQGMDFIQRLADITPKKDVKKSVEAGFSGIKGVSAPEESLEFLPTAAPKKGTIEGLISRIPDQDRSILSEPLNAKDTPFTEYAKIAKSAKVNPRNPTPMDIAGTKAKQAVDEIKASMDRYGSRKSKILKDNDANVDLSEVKDKFFEMIEDRLGARVDWDDDRGIWRLVRKGREPKRTKMLMDAVNTIEEFSDNPTALDADILKSSLSDIVSSVKSRQARPDWKITEGIILGMDSDIDNAIVKALDDAVPGLGKEFSDVNAKYGKLATLKNNMNRRLGDVTDKEKGMVRMGASLLKSSIMSNSDRGSKAMFEQVLDETGIDLIKDAKFAEIAMRASGDARIKSLLQEVSGQIPAYGKTGLVLKAMQKAANKVRKEELDEVIDFYITQQGRAAGQPPLPRGSLQ